MTQFDRQPRPIANGSPQHKVLTLLVSCYANLDELYAACACRDESVTQFKGNVIQPLRKRELLEAGPAGTLRITDRGRQAIGLPTLNKPPRGVFARERDEPAEMRLAPGVERWMLTSSPGQARSMTEADKLPPPVRSDGMEHLQHPSRRGNRLYYRDGRVTDMAGNPIEVGA